MFRLSRIRPNYIFCAIWLGTAFVFAYQAKDSYKSMDTKLRQVSTGYPREQEGILLNKVDLSKMLTQFADANNENARELEKSIRESAKVSFSANIFSCFLALFGFAAQIADLIVIKRSDRASESGVSSK